MNIYKYYQFGSKAISLAVIISIVNSPLAFAEIEVIADAQDVDPVPVVEVLNNEVGPQPNNVVADDQNNNKVVNLEVQKVEEVIVVPENVNPEDVATTTEENNTPISPEDIATTTDVEVDIVQDVVHNNEQSPDLVVVENFAIPKAADTTAPTITVIKPSGSSTTTVTINVGGVYNELGANVSDNKDLDLVAVITGTVNTATAGSYYVYYNAVDRSGNQAVQKVRWVKVIDNIAPVITLNGENPMYFEAGGNFTDPGASVTDNSVDPTLSVVLPNTSGINFKVPATHSLKYSSTDKSGNKTEVTRTLIIRDTTGPVITLNGAAIINLNIGDVYVELGATAKDNVDTNSTVTILDNNIDTSAGSTQFVLYKSVDSRGNKTEIYRKIVIKDMKGPVITLNGGVNVNSELGQPYVELGATAEDDSGEPFLIVEMPSPSEVNTNMLGVYNLKYSSMDISGNVGEAFRRVNVVDTTAPVITLKGANPMTVSASTIFTDPGVTVTDNDVNINKTPTITGTVNTNILGEHIISYKVIDPSGNSTIKTRTVNVIDTTGPKIDLIGGNTIYLNVGDTYVDPGFTAIDNIDGPVFVNVSSDNIDTSSAATFHAWYEAGDHSGNRTSVTRTIVVRDTEGPVITLIGGNHMVIEVGNPYIELGATAEDNSSEPFLIVEMPSPSEVNTNMLGVYHLRYSSMDVMGNVGTAIRTVSVIDGTIPVIRLNGSNTINLFVGDNYTEQGAVVTDNYDKNIHAVINGSVDTSYAGTYVIRYNAVDSSGNNAVEVTRTINVTEVPDTEAPKITLLGDNPLVLNLGEAFVEPGAYVQDNKDNSVTVVLPDPSIINENIAGTYNLVYTSTDKSGNTTSVTRVVRVIRTITVDQTAPVIILNGAPRIVIKVGDKYEDAGAYAQDNSGENINVVVAGEVNVNVAGTYTIKYSAKDSAGNQATEVTRTVVVENPPVNNSDSNSTGSSSGGSRSSGGGYNYFAINNQGTVLGAYTANQNASTSASTTVCATGTISSYMKRGGNNKVDDVKKLQVFLNKFLKINLPITGFYGPMTTSAVHRLQNENAGEILNPWNVPGAPAMKSTGAVYQTTLKFINQRICK
jgi:hypothetical protein